MGRNQRTAVKSKSLPSTWVLGVHSRNGKQALLTPSHLARGGYDYTGLCGCVSTLDYFLWPWTELCPATTGVCEQSGGHRPAQEALRGVDQRDFLARRTEQRSLAQKQAERPCLK